jgi:hypothetical protein
VLVGLTKVPMGIDGWPVAELRYITTDNRFAWMTGIRKLISSSIGLVAKNALCIDFY